MTFKLNQCQVCPDLIPRATRADGFKEAQSIYNKKIICPTTSCEERWENLTSTSKTHKRKAAQLIRDTYLNGIYKKFNFG